MRIVIDTDSGRLIIEDTDGSRDLDLYSPEAFAAVSRHWVRIGWSQRYSYGFSWLGRPVIQLPEDLVRMQEVIWRVRPDAIVETGVAHGGSLVFYAGLLELLGRGRVIGVDIEIRSTNRAAIDQHPLSARILLVEGDSAAPETLNQVRRGIAEAETVMVVLDSNHTKAHVRAELEAYAPLVTPGSYIVATDGIMCDLHDVPGGRPEWVWDHATAAAAEFAATHPEFVLENLPPRVFQEGRIEDPVTYWPGGWLRRR